MTDDAAIDLDGQTALITGASRGIGEATAHRLAAAGARVVLVSRNAEKLSGVAAAIKRQGGDAEAAVCDVGDAHAVRALTDRLAATHGQIGILVNNAGTIDPIAPLAGGDPAAWAASIRTNVLGPYNGMRAVLPAMIERGSGTIVSIGSGAANSALEGWSAYCVAKAGLKKLTECAHAEAGPAGVVVVGLSPGTVATDMMARIRDSGINPVSRLDWSVHIPPDWAARAVLYLCGPNGRAHAGTDFSIKTDEGRRAAGLPTDGERIGAR